MKHLWGAFWIISKVFQQDGASGAHRDKHQDGDLWLADFPSLSYCFTLLTQEYSVIVSLKLLQSNCVSESTLGETNLKQSACQCRRHRRLEFDPWVRNIPWRRKWKLTTVFLSGEFHGQRRRAGYSPWGHKELDMTEHAPKLHKK